MTTLCVVIAAMLVLVLLNNAVENRGYSCPVCGTRNGKHRPPCPRAEK